MGDSYDNEPFVPDSANDNKGGHKVALYPNPYGLNAGLNMNQQPYTLNQLTASTPQNNGINWVQGVEGAKAYQVAPNSNVLLMDSENNGRMYIKTCDNIGMCTLRYFDYVETTAAPAKTPEIDTSQFVTRTELSNIISELKEGMSNEHAVSTAKPTPQLNTNQRPSNDFKH